MRENCTLLVVRGEKNNNMPAITFLQEKEEIKREKTTIEPNFSQVDKLKKEKNTINSSFCVLQNNLKTFSPISN